MNRRLGEALGLVCGGSLPRFAWKWAPDEPYFVYDRDNRTLLKKCWADAPAPGGGTLGGVWVLSEWRLSMAFDHMGFAPACGACNGLGQRINSNGVPFEVCGACGGVGSIAGIRIPRVSDSGYAPYFETALAPGEQPTEELTANYIWAIRRQLASSSEQDSRSFENYMNEEKYSSDANARRQQEEWRETARAGYDENTGAMGNCLPGTRGGFLSLPSTSREILPGFGDI